MPGPAGDRGDGTALLGAVCGHQRQRAIDADRELHRRMVVQLDVTERTQHRHHAGSGGPAAAHTAGYRGRSGATMSTCSSITSAITIAPCGF
ncbi:hypothetical protein [Mycolicibacterium septicum]|uniref:hypothetical protein n=1 Tax=Mycolicibacterium septicum TaxID=98668 RepID=UPI001AF6BB4F|nr:hypothetical protein [Mycolicibacterium septicum]QRY49476.1 hypothetical protein JVX95_17975 [Mycolicibacterium septicum]